MEPQLWQQRCFWCGAAAVSGAFTFSLTSPFCLPCGAPNLHQSAAWCSAPPSRTATPSARQCASGSPGAAPPASSSWWPSALSPALVETPPPACRQAATRFYWQEFFFADAFLCHVCPGSNNVPHTSLLLWPKDILFALSCCLCWLGIGLLYVSPNWHKHVLNLFFEESLIFIQKGAVMVIKNTLYLDTLACVFLINFFWNFSSSLP